MSETRDGCFESLEEVRTLWNDLSIGPPTAIFSEAKTYCHPDITICDVRTGDDIDLDDATMLSLCRTTNYDDRHTDQSEIPLTSVKLSLNTMKLVMREKGVIESLLYQGKEIIMSLARIVVCGAGQTFTVKDAMTVDQLLVQLDVLFEGGTIDLSPPTLVATKVDDGGNRKMMSGSGEPVRRTQLLAFRAPFHHHHRFLPVEKGVRVMLCFKMTLAPPINFPSGDKLIKLLSEFDDSDNIAVAPDSNRSRFLDGRWVSLNSHDYNKFLNWQPALFEGKVPAAAAAAIIPYCEGRMISRLMEHIKIMIAHGVSIGLLLDSSKASASLVLGVQAVKDSGLISEIQRASISTDRKIRISGKVVKPIEIAAAADVTASTQDRLILIINHTQDEADDGSHQSAKRLKLK
jgi:hypothetical protein